MPVSDDTKIRHLKRHVAAALLPPSVRVVCVDDWGRVKVSICGTLIVDPERTTVIDILRDRSAESTGARSNGIQKWKLVSRDRCGVYAQERRTLGPVVADRFHLLQNLKTTIERQLSRTSLFVEPPMALKVNEPVFASSNVVVKIKMVTLTELAEHRDLMKQTRRAAREASFDRVKGLLAACKSFNDTVRETGPNWLTVGRWKFDTLRPANCRARSRA